MDGRAEVIVGPHLLITSTTNLPTLYYVRSTRCLVLPQNQGNKCSEAALGLKKYNVDVPIQHSKPQSVLERAQLIKHALLLLLLHLAVLLRRVSFTILRCPISALENARSSSLC